MIFVVASLNKLELYKDSVNCIRVELHEAIKENYHLVHDSRNGSGIITKDLRDEAILRVNNHGLRHLNEDEFEALSSIVDVVQAQYLIDNGKGSMEELKELEVKVERLMGELEEVLLLDD